MPTSLSELAEIGGAAGVPAVPTALSSFHFRSDSMNESGVSPAFRQPVTVAGFAAVSLSCIGWLAAGGWLPVGGWPAGGRLPAGVCADTPTANNAAANVPVMTLFIVKASLAISCVSLTRPLAHHQRSPLPRYAVTWCRRRASRSAYLAIASKCSDYGGPLPPSFTGGNDTRPSFDCIQTWKVYPLRSGQRRFRDGLQSRSSAKVAELADAPDLGSGSRKALGVRLPPFALLRSRAVSAPARTSAAQGRELRSAGTSRSRTRVSAARSTAPEARSGAGRRGPRERRAWRGAGVPAIKQ